MRRIYLLALVCLWAVMTYAQTPGSPLTPNQNATGNITATGATCATTNACVVVHLQQGVPSIAVTATGTWSATLTAESSADNGNTWVSQGTIAANGQTTYTLTAQTDFRVRCSAFTSGTAAIFINVSTPTIVNIGGASSSSGGGTGPSSAYTFSVNAGTVTAVNNSTGVVAFTGTDAAVVINSALAAIGTTGGRLFFKNGVYNINSMTLETATGCSNLGGSGAAVAYGIGFPQNGAFANSTGVQWLLEGESTPIWQGESLSTVIPSTGVIFNVTATAVSSVTAGSVLNGFWQRPVTNCNLAATNVSNDVHYKNMSVRFPVNTRGNEIAFNNWFSADVEHENTVADFNVGYNTIATGSAPTVGTYNSIGMTSTVSSAGNWQKFANTFTTGYNLGYDWQTEHILSETSSAIYCNIPAEFGRSGGTVGHSSLILHFNDQENGGGIVFGNQMAYGSRVDFIGHTMEVGGDANWYTTARNVLPAWSEVNSGYTSGLIAFTFTKENTGIITLPTLNLFSSGGTRFQSIPNTQSPSFALAPVTDSFAHPNGAIGPDWRNNINGGTNPCQATILSNAATYSAIATCSYAAQAFTAGVAQTSRATVSAINAASAVGVTVNSSNTVGTPSKYEYIVSTSGGLITNRGIYVVSAGNVSNNLVQTTSASGVAANDIIELTSIPVGTTNYLIAYYCPAGVCPATPDLITSDATLSGGSPGIFFNTNGSGNASLSNWSGGSLAQRDSVYSIYSRPMYAPTYNTLTNCAVNSVSPAACGSAPSGVIVVPTLTTTYTVNTTAVTANSRIFLQPTSDNTGIPSAPTCATLAVTSVNMTASRVTGTSFTFSTPSTTGTTCFNYWIVN
jgi:hypothetical protein